MEYQKLAGITMFVGFVLVMIASLIAPNEVYSAPDSQTRLEIIAQNRSRWQATNLIWVVGSLVTAVGLLFLTLGLQRQQSPWIPYIATSVFAIGSIAWAIYLYQRIGDPADNLYTTPPPSLSMVFAWATIAGLALFGVAFIQGIYPNWLGYTLLVAMGLLVVGLVFFFERIYDSFPPQFFYLLTLIMGIVALRL
jgi:hypothetical protein